MHARELIELAGLAASHGPLLIESGLPIPAEAIEQYWLSSKVRLDRWARTLKDFGTPTGADRRKERIWPPACSAVEEILVSEVLTRVWTTLLCGYDRKRGSDVAEPVARSVMIGQMEARHRALTLLTQSPGIQTEAARRLDRLRRRADHWTDLLVGYLAATCDITEFAADPERAEDFTEEMRGSNSRQQDRVVWPLVLASLRAAFQELSAEPSPNADVNGRIAGSMLACFPADLFGATGLFHSLWLMRLMGFADDTQVLLDDLLAAERRPSPSTPDLPRDFRDIGARRFRP